MTTGSKIVLDPSGHVWAPKPRTAPRASSLAGKIVGILDDGAPNTGYLMDRVGELMVKEYGAAGIVTRRKSNFSRTAPPEMLEELRSEVDAVVVGVGA